MSLTFDEKKVISKIYEATKSKARAERRDITHDEERLLDTTIALLDNDIDDSEADEVRGYGTGRSVTQETGDFDISSGKFRRKAERFTPRGPGADKSYRSMFGNAGAPKWQDDSIGFFGAVHSDRHHPELQNRAMTEALPSGGGYLVPSEWASEIHAVALENEIVQPRAMVVPMKSNEMHLPGFVIGDHSSNLFGGFTASYRDEASTISEADPKVRDMLLTTNKLTGLIKYSAELSQDVPNFEEQIRIACGKGLGWYRDDAFISGNGAGKPLGVMAAGCTITQAEVSGQDNDTIVYENLTSMLAHLWTGSFEKAVWLANPSTIPQLLSITIAIGDAGSFYPVLNESNGKFTMLTRPVIFTEKLPILGDEGDLMLCDFSQYLIGLRGGMRYDISPHVSFAQDMLYGRLIERHCGQPLWNEALTLKDGSSTVSPFVMLGERDT